MELSETNSSNAHAGKGQNSNDVLRVVVNRNGSLGVTEPVVEFNDFRKAHTRPDMWLEVLNWIDAWAEDQGIIDALCLDDVSLWWFSRNSMIERFFDLLSDIEAVGALVVETRPKRLTLENANDYWRDVCQVVAEKSAIEFHVEVSSYRNAQTSWATRLARVCVFAARTMVGILRNGKLRKPVNILTLGYSTWRRVIVDGVPRYIDPSYELVLDELQRLGLPVTTLNAPSSGSVTHQLTWLNRGDSDAVPFEYSIAKWWARTWFTSKRYSDERLRQRVGKILSDSEQSSTTWKGYDVSKLILKFLENQLFRRANRAAWLTSFFSDFLERAKPRVLFLNNEYSGVAMAVCAAARRKRIPIVSVQHGVIWRAHYGYVLPRKERDTMPRIDTLCLFGDYDRQLIVEHGVYGTDELVVTGSPRIDLITANRPGIDRQRLTEQLGLPSDIPLLLFTSIGDRGGLLSRRLIDFVAAAEKPLSVIVKLHPSAEPPVELYSSTAAEKGLKNVRVVSEHFDLYDLFRIVDVHMSVNSTSLSEAVLFGTPNIMLGTDLFMFVDTIGYLERNVAVAAESYPSLSAAMEDVLHGPASERLRQGRDAFIAHQYFQLDGNASARVAAVVQRFAAGNS
jgi:hypothetical protein